MAAIVLLSPLTAMAQLAPTGGHYAARESDTGFANATNSQGGYDASVPLEFPSARDGMAVPLRVTYGGRRFGAAGLGWDIPVAYIYRDVTVSQRRPANLPDVGPQAREQLSLMLDGRRIELVPNRTQTAWLGRRNSAQIEVRTARDSLVMYDGAGHTYIFNAQGAAAGTRLAGGNLYLLRTITGAHDIELFHFEYSLRAPEFSTGGKGVEINLAKVRYNADPDSTCSKTEIVLSYDAAIPEGSAPFVSMLGSTAIARTTKLLKILVNNVATCSDRPTLLRSYLFDYAAEPDTQQLRLTSVTMTGRVGTNEQDTVLPVATYDYGDSAGGDAHRIVYRKTQTIPVPVDTHQDLSGIGTTVFAGGVTPVGASISQQNLLDLNGDGRLDLIKHGVWMRNTPVAGGKSGFPREENLFVSPISPDLDFVGQVQISALPRSIVFHTTGQSRSFVHQQLIDFNGDGRLDLVRDSAMGPALAPLGTWTVLLNTPDPADPKKIVWVSRSISTVPLARALRDAGYEGYEDPTTALVSLALTTTTNDSLFNHCWRWGSDSRWTLTLDGYSASGNNRCPPPQGQVPSRDDYASLELAKKTITQYAIRDINGDGYPDFVYNASRMVNALGPVGPPAQPGSFVGQFTVTQRLATSDIGGSRDVKALLNIAGVQINAATPAFSAPITLEVAGAEGCGVERWEATAESIGGSKQDLVCGFEDVNGDGLVDRVNSLVSSGGRVGVAALGTGDLSEPFSTTARITLNGPLARVESDLVAKDELGNTRPRACPNPIPPSGTDATFPVQRTAGLRDLNGDGIPDYIVGDNSTGTTAWSVRWGTGSGFASAIPIGDTSNANFELSLETVNCGGSELSSTKRGLYDLDGDGRPEIVAFSGSQFFDGTQLISEAQLDVFHLNAQPNPQNTSAGNVPSAPIEGRLTRIDNGYGAGTALRYRSAKEDGTTLHQVPFPEIVITSVGVVDAFDSPLMTPEQYAYGNAELVFDPTADAFRFPGYRRLVRSRITTQQVAPEPTEGMATITDSYGLAAFDSSLDARGRLGRYLKMGRARDVTVLSGTIGTEPWSLLGASINNDARRIEGAHYDWDTRLLAPGASNNESCLDMVLPYDFEGSRSQSLGRDLCAERGFAFQTSMTTFRGSPGTQDASTSTSVVRTRTDVTEVDDLGRTLVVKNYNDALASTDDLMITTAYAAPTGSNERVLSAVKSRVVTDFAGTRTYNSESFEYDTLAFGNVSTGFVTAHTISRFDLGTGAAMGTIREFDATYDSIGNPLTMTSRRDDGAVRKVTTAYDFFALAPLSSQTEGTNANGTKLPAMLVTIARDPVTLEALGTTDVNGTQRGNTFDGFGRVLLSTVTPAGGTLGALTSTSYEGFAVGERGGRKVVSKAFTDPVVPDAVATTAGRASTVLLDSLGREIRTDLALGSDYGGKSVVTGVREYDKLGRVLFEADPFVSGDSGSRYGTSQLFNIDGTPSCTIRAFGAQRALNDVNRKTDETSERYPTCFKRYFENNKEIVRTVDADSLLTGSPQAGVFREAFFDATGLPKALITYAGVANSEARGASLDRLLYSHDALGNVASMTRYQNPTPSSATEPAAASNPVTTSWRYDSLGQLLEFNEPDSAAQLSTYDSFGALTQMQWVNAANPSADRRSLTSYDALGRVTHREDRASNQVDTDTIKNYSYDRPVALSSRVNPTFTLGRLASASAVTSSVAFSYDALGRTNANVFVDEPRTTEGVYVQTMEYHGDGSPSALHLLLPDNGFKDERVNYTYDSANRMRTARSTDGAITQDLFVASTIDPLGDIRQAQYGAAAYSATYADTGRRLLSNLKVTSSSGSTREISFISPTAVGNAFDPVGRERGRREIKNGASNAPVLTWSYDNLGQLSSGTRTPASNIVPDTQFTYDALGNVLRRIAATGSSGATLSYQTTDRDRVCSVAYASGTPGTPCNVKYDDLGNITEQPTRSNGLRKLTYFPNGQVKRVTDGNTNDAQFRYDAFGALQWMNLTSNTAADTRHDRHYGTLISRRDETVSGTSRSVIVRAIPAPGLIAKHHGPNGNWVFAFGEGRGNRFFTDESGAFIQDVDYQSYGEASATCGASSTTCAPGSPAYTSAQWNGGDALAALGLSQLGARLYDPVIGRFLSRDPLLVPRTASKTNPYAFAANDPVNSSDPTGLDRDGDNTEIPDLEALCIGCDLTQAEVVNVTGTVSASTERDDGDARGAMDRGDALGPTTPKPLGPACGANGHSHCSADGRSSPEKELFTRTLREATRTPVPVSTESTNPISWALQYAKDVFSTSLDDAFTETTRGILNHYGQGAVTPSRPYVADSLRPAINTVVDIGVDATAAFFFTAIALPETRLPSYLGRTGKLTYRYGFEAGEQAALEGKVLALGKYPGNVRYVRATPGTATVDVPALWSPTYNAGYIRGFIEGGGSFRLTSQNFTGTFGKEIQQILSIPGQ